MIRRILYFFLLTILAGGCRAFMPQESPGKKSDNNLAYIYNPSTGSLHPMVTVYHVSDSVSYFTLGLSVSELQFSQANSLAQFLTQIRIYYVLNENEKSGGRSMVDTGSYVYTLRKDALKNVFITSVPFKAMQGKEYMLRVSTTDMIRKKTTEVFVPVNKSNVFSGQNFQLYSGSESQTVLLRHFNSSQRFNLRYRNPGYSRIFVAYYQNKQPLPRPIYSPEMEENQLTLPDTTWSLNFNDTTQFSLPKSGLYLFRLDTTKADGLALFNYGDYFPTVKTVDDMLGPLVYLASSKEYQDLEKAPGRKLAIDNFWLGCAGNMDKARELIRIYYNRVFFANYYFSADREGWKTDRGMIFIVFGPPNTLYKSEDEEKWIYFKNPGLSITFTFRKAATPWTQNLYFLLRAQAPDTHWRMAVDSWRSGKVYQLE